MTIVRLFCEQEMEVGASESLAAGGGRVVVFSRHAPDKNSLNEDGAAVIGLGDEAAVLVVADGVGGQPAGRHAAALALETIAAHIARQAENPALLRSAILDGLEEANRVVLARGDGAATTVAIAEIQGATVRTYHVGDAMVLLIGQRGKLKLQTISHSPVGYAIEAGVLNEVDAMHHADRHLVSNVLGAADMRIEIGPTVDMAPRDTLLLGSDGLFDNLHLAEVIAHARCGRLETAVAQLSRSAAARMHVDEPGHPSKPDDLTFLLYRRQAEGPRRPPDDPSRAGELAPR